MSFTEWSNAKKKKEESSKSPSATKSTSGGSGMSFTEWSNTKTTGSAITGYNDKDAVSGWQKFQAEQKKKREKEEEKSWFEKAIAMFAQTSDSTLPGANITNATNAYRNDTSYREPTDSWSEQQKKDFGYLYSQSPEQAWKYAEGLNNSIAKAEKEKQEAAVKASATDGFWKGAAHTAGAIATAPMGLADYLDNMAEYTARGKVTEKAGMTPFDYSQTVTGGISKNLNDKYGTLDDDIWVIGGKGLGDVYGLGTSIAQSAFAGYTGGQAGTLIQFFGSAAASGFDEAKQRGASDDQALSYGTLVGAAEGLAEMVGVDNLLNIGSSSTMKQLLKNIAKQGAAEGIEEGLTTLMNNFADQIVMQDKSNFNLMVQELMNQGMSEEEAKKKAWLTMANDLAFDMVAGFASGTIHAGPQTAYQTAMENIYQPYWEGKTIMEADGSVDALKQLADEVAGVSSADMQQAISEQTGKLNDKQSALNVGRLYETVQNANNLANASANQADIAKSLQRKGFTAQEAKAVAEALVTKYNGQELSKAQKNTLASVKGNTAVQDAISNIMTNAKSTMGQRSDNIRNFQKDVSIGRIAKAHGMSADDVKKIAEDVFTAPDENGSESHYEVSVDGKTIDRDGNIVTIKGISSIENGRMVLDTETGTVDAGDVSYASQGEALVYEAVSKLEGIIDTETANKLSKHLLKLGDVSSDVYANAIQQAYTYGYYGYGRDRMTGENTLSATLTEKQRNVAYGLGEQYRAARTAAEQKAVSKKETTTQKVSGKVHFDGDRSTLTERQSASLSAMEKVAEALGVQIYVFESKVDERGKRIGANGWYDPKDSSIHIDLHAGATGEGTMLFTAAHELTHHIRKWSPAKFKVLADFLMQEYGKKGVNVDALVHAQMEKAQRNGRTISYDTAYEEVIADSMETMLSDGNVVEKLAKLKQVDKSLWQKIKDFISDLVSKIRKVYEGMSPDSAEGRFVKDMVDSIEKLQDLFTEALVDASENYQSSEQVLAQAGISVNAETDSGSLLSVRDVLSDADRKKVAKALADRFNVTEKEALEWLKAETSLASLILNPKYSMFLDYEADPNEVAIKQNSDYPQGTVDFSNICKKRREFTQVMNRILRNFPNHVFAATDLARIRTIMGEEGMTLPCGICYVEDRRQLDTIVAQDFINGLKLYREGSKTRPDGKPFNANQLKGLKLTDGDDYVPSIYELVTLEGRNSLKAKNPNMEAAWVRYNNARGMQAVRLLTNEAEYKRQILKYNKNTVKSKNDHGGLRIYSFSDMEMFHLIDVIQVITDSSAVGLSIQGYTKVNEYAKAVKDTGLKLNRSLIPKGDLGYHMENGKVVLDYDTVEGIDIHSEDFFDSTDNPNVGNITIGINDTQIRAAMVSDFVDYIIPFHTGQSEEVLGEKGIGKWDNYKDFQTEKDLATGKTSAHQINIYTEVFQAAEAEGKPIQNKRQFVEKFLAVCKENGLKPRFAQFLNTDANGDYIYTEGYHKFLVDFKTFAQTEVGEYLPQKPVKPIFDDAYITGLLEAYVKEQQAKDAEVAKQMPKVIERITNEIIKPSEIKRSDRDNAPTFYSQMAKVVDGVKQNKLGAASVVSMLRGKGVKAEEIKWSGIEDWLAGKKSVTKAELQEFIAGSMLQIEEDMLTDKEIPYSQEHLDQIAKYEAERDIIAENLKSEWKRIVGTDIPITNFGAGLESAVVHNLLEANATKKGNTEAGYKYKAKRAALQRVIEDGDHYFGFDNARQAFREAVRDPNDFMNSYEMTSFEKGVFRDFIKAKEAYNKVEGISVEDQRTLKAIAESADRFSNRILKVKTEHRTEAAKYLTKYRGYTIKGGTNYRELLFRMPGATYSNGAMDVHWERSGVLAHARMQDLNTFLGKMLFIEEIQSDWHNEGHKSGYTSAADVARISELEDQIAQILTEKDKINQEYDAFLTRYWEEDLSDEEYREYLSVRQERLFDLSTEQRALERELYELSAGNDVPDAPFKDNYHEYVLKRLIRMAAEQDYDSIGWTTAQIQSDRWSEEFAEGYRIEYDQDIPKFLNKYGKKWGTKVGKTVLDSGTEVWSMAITDEMKDSVLTEGQPLYSFRGTNQDGIEVYETSDEVKNLSRKERQQRFLDLMVNEYRGRTAKFIRNGHAYYATFDEKDINKNIYGDKRSDKKGYRAKINAGADGDIFELVENAKYNGSLPEKGKKITAHKGVGYWDYFIKNVQVDGIVYDLTANVRKKADGAFVYSIQLNENKKIKASPPLGLLSKALNGVTNASGTNVTQPGSNVNMHSDRDTESVSDRSLLANAFEGVAQNDIERQKIQEYKGKIDLINAEERKLTKLNEQIKDLSFAKGPKDTKAIRDLQFEAKQTANRISTYDKQLLRLEASKPLQNVLSREKKLAYQRAEKKGKEALAAYREKATKTQRELLTKYQDARQRATENREKTAMRHKVQNVVKELNDLLLNESKKRHVPDSLKKAVADALSLVNMDTVGAEERAAKYAALIAKETDPDKIDAYTVTMENILRQGDKMGQRLKELRDAYEEIQESDDPDIANAYDPVIAGCLKELAGSIGNTSLRNMTIEQLSDVYDMYKMVLTRVRDANKTLLENIKENISNLASRVIGEVRMTGGEHKYRAAVLDPVRKFMWNNLKPVYAMEHIGSSTLTKVFDNVRGGEDTWARDVTEAREYYLDKSKKYGYDSWDFKKKYRFQSASELEFELTLDQILSLYAYSKRNQAHDHLRLGGFVFDSNIETYKDKDSKILKYKVNTADAHQITPEILADIIGKLSKEQMAFVDEMQDYLSTVMGAKGNEVTMKMYGVKLFKEKFYFPLKSAKQFMFEQNEVSGEVKIKNSGFTNKVVAKANNPVILSNFMDVWSGHVNDMSMYHAFVLPLEDFNRVFNYNSPKKENEPSVSVKGTIQNAYSPAAVNYVKNLITDLNGGARTDSTTGIINKMMGLFKKGSVFASLSVVVQQPSAVARAAALVDTKYFIGPKVDHKRHKLLWDEVKQYAPVAIIKEMGYFDTNMGKSTQDFIQGKEYSGFKEKMKALVTDSDYRDEILSKAPALADEIAWCSIWEAVKRETKAKNKGMDVKSEAFLRKCGERFTEVITKTQVYDSVLARSANMRSKDTGMKMATAFMAEPTTSINMIADALLQGKRGNRKYARAAIGAVIASQILNSILVSFVYAGRDDDEDETYWEKYIGTLSGEIIDSLNPAGYIPFIKDIMSIVQGYDVERSDMAVISDLWNAYQKLGSDKLSVYRKVEGFAGSIAQIFGLPLKNIMRDVRGIYQTINSFMNGPKTTKAGIGYAVKGAITGKTVANDQQLYEAMVSGDKAHIARVKSRFKDASAVNSAIRLGLREHDPRIREAAIAWNANDLDEYMRIAKSIIGEKHFSQDDVVMAIRAEASKLAPDSGETTTAKSKGLFTAEKFAEAISQGDDAMAYSIMTDIVQTSQKNGATASDAQKSFGSSASSACKKLFLDGGMTVTQAENALVDYCGLEREAAQKRVGEWKFEYDYGYSYSDRAEAYKKGAISAYEMKPILMNVGGRTSQEADNDIRAYEWMKNNPSYDISVSDVLAYTKTIEDIGVSVEESGIDPDMFVEYRVRRSKCKGVDEDNDGAADRNSVKNEVLEVINDMPITSYQKDVLYYLNGWAKSNLRKAPWH